MTVRCIVLKNTLFRFLLRSRHSGNLISGDYKQELNCSDKVAWKGKITVFATNPVDTKGYPKPSHHQLVLHCNDRLYTKSDTSALFTL